jgi:hypothetical protein
MALAMVREYLGRARQPIGETRPSRREAEIDSGGRKSTGPSANISALAGRDGAAQGGAALALSSGKYRLQITHGGPHALQVFLTERRAERVEGRGWREDSLHDQHF